MTRLYILGGSIALLCALTYLSPTITELIPGYHLDIGHFVIPAVQFIVSAVGIVAGALAFDVIASGLSTSVLAEVGAAALVRFRAYVNRSLNPLAEVQRSGRGTVGLTSL